MIILRKLQAELHVIFSIKDPFRCCKLPSFQGYKIKRAYGYISFGYIRKQATFKHRSQQDNNYLHFLETSKPLLWSEIFCCAPSHTVWIHGCIWILKASLLYANNEWAACPWCVEHCVLWGGALPTHLLGVCERTSSGHCINHLVKEASWITYSQLSCQNRTVHVRTPASPPPLVKCNHVLLWAFPQVVLAHTQGRPWWAQELLLTDTRFGCAQLTSYTGVDQVKCLSPMSCFGNLCLNYFGNLLSPQQQKPLNNPKQIEETFKFLKCCCSQFI